MAGLSSQGLGSGLDIAGLVAKLVAAEKAPRAAQITREQSSTVTTLSALGQLKGAMSSFNDALAGLKTQDVFAARTTTSSDSDVLTASATTDAIPGSYDIEVESVASAHQLSSTAFAQGAGQTVGTGTLTINVGTTALQISIDSSHQTLAQIRDAINAADSNGTLVRATIINATDGAHLVLSAQSSGAANAITVSQTGGDGGLSRLEYSTLNTVNYAETHKAADAVIYVSGFQKTSSTNTFTDAIDGVTITALQADDNVTKTLTVAKDTSGTATRIKNFVGSYNALESQMAKLRSYEPSTKVAGPLLGDAMLRNIESDMRNKLTSPVSGATGAYQTLASIGITTQKDGTLALDSTKLDAALAADYDGVSKLFGSDDGVGKRLSDALTERLSDDAELNQRTKALNQKSIDLQKDAADLELRMQDVTARYNQQFNTLDSLLSTMQSQSSFLTQQLSSIANIGKS